MAFKRVFQDVDTRYMAFKAFADYEDEIVTYDHGTAANVGRVLSSPDGATWSTLFLTLPAAVGNANADDGNGIAIYDDNLFVTLYRSDATNPKIIEWNGSNVIEHLPNPQGGGNNNYMAHNLVNFDEKLWIVTDATAMIADHRRVVYYYDGTSWTAITDYDGADYLNFNVGAGLPANQTLHRRTRLMVIAGELYLFATRHNGTCWGWQVWRFDMENYDNFTLLYESYEGFGLAAVWELNDKTYVIVNPHQGVNPVNYSKLYSADTMDMETWTEHEDAFEDLFDDFGDDIRDSRWDDSPGNGSITEAGGLLTLAVAGGVNGDPTTANAPIATIEAKQNRATIITKLNSYTVNDDTRAGLYITSAVVPGTGFYFTRYRNDSFGRNGLQVKTRGGAQLAYVAVTTMPIWLRIQVSGSDAVNSWIEFDYSTDGYAWTNLLSTTGVTWSYAGLVAGNWGVLNAISAPFEEFNVFKDIGFAYGEYVYKGKAYLNCSDILSAFGLIHSFREGLTKFKLEQMITSLKNSKWGELFGWEEYLYSGKYREIYRAFSRSLFGVTEKNLMRKKHSTLLTEWTFKNRKGEELKENYAFIDTRSPDRFYQGRIRSCGGLKRALDDKTGMFQNADWTVTLDNSDRKFSILLSNYFLKNQLVKVYHHWTEEPEVWRQHVITLVVEDYSLKGTDFVVKLKDITRRYFSKKMPPQICTKEEYPYIYPEHIGRHKPEILGLANNTITEKKLGAVEAVYVNTAKYWYLAAASPLTSIPQVYSDDVLMATPADYTWGLIGGEPIIVFAADQGTKRITFNAEGYPYAAWNSVNGYVQNPAYVTLYFLRIFMGLPASLVDGAFFNTMANWCDYRGFGTSGYLILQEEMDADEITRQLLFSFGFKGFVALDGNFRINVKDISNYEINCPEEHLHEQIELSESPERLFNLTEAINTVKARYNLMPWSRLWLSGAVETQENYYGEIMEDDIHNREFRDKPVEV